MTAADHAATIRLAIEAAFYPRNADPYENVKRPALAALDRLEAERDEARQAIEDLLVSEKSRAEYIEEMIRLRAALFDAEAERDEAYRTMSLVWEALGDPSLARLEGRTIAEEVARFVAEVARLREALAAWVECSPAHRYECNPFASEDAVCSCGLQKARDLAHAALAADPRNRDDNPHPDALKEGTP